MSVRFYITSSFQPSHMPNIPITEMRNREFEKLMRGIGYASLLNDVSIGSWKEQELPVLEGRLVQFLINCPNSELWDHAYEILDTIEKATELGRGIGWS